MILPPATLGVLGGGQLGRYFVMAAQQLGYRVLVLDPDRQSVAGRIADEHMIAAFDDVAALDRLAERCAAVTIEFENVPAESLVHLANSVPVRPSAAAVQICQDRRMEKAFLHGQGIPLAPYAEIRSEAALMAASASLYPGILKVARFGYDGKGQCRVGNPDEALAAFRQYGGAACVLEKMLPLQFEVSVVLSRDEAGRVACFPPTQNVHRDGILDISLHPATRLSGEQSARALVLAETIAHKMDYIGTMAVELFVVDGELYVNEIAPRPHNSGHFTLNACRSSQFEQQVRALCGLPLGDTAAHSPALMVNILGDLWYPDMDAGPREPAWHELLSQPNLKLHLYGKEEPRRGRKMGHFTVVGATTEEVRQAGLAARACIGIAQG